MTGYDAGMRSKRITIARRAETTGGQFSQRSAGQKYEVIGAFWAAEDFTKGVKPLHNGVVDAYDIVMFRMNWYPGIDRWCIIQYDGTWYQIKSFDGSRKNNTIQITAQEMPNQNILFINT
jgi:hypothetical protein